MSLYPPCWWNMDGYRGMEYWCPRCKRELGFGERCKCNTEDKPVDATVITFAHILRILSGVDTASIMEGK